ncbi:hypothetical protein RRG08_023421 [Elysia crispata]|uniref:Uncharacterized protein n=1 Tax=Elysia crispata TaxID=231223 RepID=A0AAE1CX74_9GAST|nr:hypothetical protein RRG08_023421 [Elysia crispata]
MFCICAGDSVLEIECHPSELNAARGVRVEAHSLCCPRPGREHSEESHEKKCFLITPVISVPAIHSACHFPKLPDSHNTGTAIVTEKKREKK